MTDNTLPAANGSGQTVLEAVFPWWRSASILACALLVVGLCLLSGRPKSSSEAGVVMNLPYKLGSYWGSSEQPSVGEKILLPPDTKIERKTYDALTGEQVVCSIVLSGVERRSIHRPEICLPGQGWTIRSREVVPIKLNSGRVLKAQKLFLEQEKSLGNGQTVKLQSLFYYWFVGNKITTPEHYIRVFYSSWDLIAHNINHRWAYVIATAPITKSVRADGEDATQTATRIEDFIRMAVPRFQISEMSPEALREAGITPAEK